MNLLYSILFLLAGFSEPLWNIFPLLFFEVNLFLFLFVVLLFIFEFKRKEITSKDYFIIVVLIYFAYYYQSKDLFLFLISYYICLKNKKRFISYDCFMNCVKAYCSIVFIAQFFYLFFFDNITIGEKGFEIVEGANRSRYGIFGANSLALVLLFFILGYFQPISSRIFLSFSSIFVIISTSNKFSLIVLLLKSLSNVKKYFLIFLTIFIMIIFLDLENHLLSRFTNFEDISRLNKILGYVNLLINNPSYIFFGFGENYNYINETYKFSDNSIIELATYTGFLFSLFFHLFLLKNIYALFIKNYFYLFLLFIVALNIYNILLWIGPFFLIVESFRYYKLKN
jgi:hypothetical protein